MSTHRGFRSLVLAIGLCVLAATAVAHAQTIIYVDDDAPSGGDGTSWATAFNDLQDALDVVVAGDEIHVAQGTYKPDRGTFDRTASFELKGDVPVYGGFAGLSGLSPDDRDITAFETILTGDLFGDDGPDFANNLDNTHTIVTVEAASGVASLDGFVVTAARGTDGAISIRGSTAIVRNCLITRNRGLRNGGGTTAGDGGTTTLVNTGVIGNTTDGVGGGIYFGQSGQIMLDGCTIAENSAFEGGGVANYGGVVTLSNCVVRSNTASARGGGVFSSDGTNPSFRAVRTSFLANSAGGAGGGFYGNDGNSSFVTCLFVANDSYSGGGAIFGDSEHLTTIVNSTMTDNVSWTSSAGGVFVSEQVSISNTVLWRNYGVFGSTETAQVAHSHSLPEEVNINHSCVQGWSGILGGVGNIGADPLFVDGSGIPGTVQPDLRLRSGSPCIDAGNNDDVPVDGTTDLDGLPRFVDDPTTVDCPQAGADCGTPPIVDMGAYEFRDGCITAADCDDGDDCTDEECVDGVCSRTLSVAGTPCGDPTETVCDHADTCDGGGTCLSNLEPSTTECRPSAGACDVSEFCDGAGSCPSDGFAPAGTACGDPTSTDCDTADTCDGQGFCLANHALDGTACTDDGNDCTSDVCLDGVCDHPNLPPATPCGDPTDTVCTNPDTCNGAGVCESNHVAGGVLCGSLADTPCDNPDTCDGQGACRDNVQPNGTACETDDNSCTADVCFSAVCLHQPLPNGTPCDDDGLFCDGPEVCLVGLCQSSGDPCGAAGLDCDEDANACTCNDNLDCDDGLTCTIDSCTLATGLCENAVVFGTCLIDGACFYNAAPNPANLCEFCNPIEDNRDWSFEPEGAACETDGNPCTANECSAGECTHPPLPDETACDDGLFCNGTDECLGGQCLPVGVDPCPDTDCDEDLDACGPLASVVNWASVAIHGPVGPISLLIPADGSFTEPRNAGVTRLVVAYDRNVSVTPDTTVTVDSCDGSGSPVDLSGIAIAVLQSAPHEVAITFTPALPGSGYAPLSPGDHDPVRYRVELANVGGAEADTSREFTVVLGDAFGLPFGTGDARVNAQDNGFIRSLAAQGIGPIDPGNIGQVRADIVTNGVINAQDSGLGRALAQENLNGQGLAVPCP